MKPYIRKQPEKVHQAEHFTWKGNIGIAEVSQLGDNPFCPVYDDACDEGFVVTGATRDIIFVIDHVHRNREEIEFWHLTSISEEGFTITLFND